MRRKIERVSERERVRESERERERGREREKSAGCAGWGTLGAPDTAIHLAHPMIMLLLFISIAKRMMMWG